MPRRGEPKRTGQAGLNLNYETKLNMKTENRFYKEPTHDEIALSAFLAWERDGRPQGTDLHYWIQAEAALRAQREKQAAAAAAQAAKPWPPQARVARPARAKETKPKLAAPVAPVAKAAPKKAAVTTAAKRVPAAPAATPALSKARNVVPPAAPRSSARPSR